MITDDATKVFYVNCTATAPHIGCLAVTDGHFNQLLGDGYNIVDLEFASFPWAALWTGDRRSSRAAVERAGFIERIRGADVIVINGEGTIHHAPGFGLLMLAEAAKAEGREVYLVNTSLFFVDGLVDILKSLDGINVREQRSSDFLTCHGVDHELILDSFLSARFADFATCDYSGRTLITDWHPSKDRKVGNVLIDLRDRSRGSCEFYPMNHMVHQHAWRSSVENVRSADFVVTARYHGVYLAAMAAKPFVALPSNTPKISGLFETSGLPIRVARGGREIEREIRKAREDRTLYEEFSEFLKSQMPLSTFAKLREKVPGRSTLSPSEALAARDTLESRISSTRDRLQIESSYNAAKWRVNPPLLNMFRKTARRCVDLAFGSARRP